MNADDLTCVKVKIYSYKFIIIQLLRVPFFTTIEIYLVFVHYKHTHTHAQAAFQHCDPVVLLLSGWNCENYLNPACAVLRWQNFKIVLATLAPLLLLLLLSLSLYR